LRRHDALAPANYNGASPGARVQVGRRANVPIVRVGDEPEWKTEARHVPIQVPKQVWAMAVQPAPVGNLVAGKRHDIFDATSQTKRR